MKIFSLYIEKYMKFEKQEIKFNSENISLYDIIDIQAYFEKLTQRAVDIVEPAGLRNPYRRNTILATKEILYAA